MATAQTQDTRYQSATGLRMCARCVMDESDPTIAFDEAGVCNHCKAFEQGALQWAYQGRASDEQLEALVAEIKKRGRRREYDCVLGVSGGVDSSYLAYRLQELGLRTLAVHFDNGWNSELAVKNVERLVKLLDMDYQTYVVDWEEFRDLQVAFLRASVPNAEIPTDHGLMGALYRVALDHGVKTVLTGANYVTEGILPQSWAYNARDLTHLKAIHRRFGTTPLKTFPLLGWKREVHLRYVRGIRRYRLLHFMPYVKAEAMEVLERDLGWVYYGGKHYESNFTKFFQAYILPRKFGIDKRKAHLSTLIASGQATREEALEELEKPLYPEDRLREDKAYVIKKLGLSEDEFEAIMDLPPKQWHDYPNEERFLRRLSELYGRRRL